MHQLPPALRARMGGGERRRHSRAQSRHGWGAKEGFPGSIGDAYNAQAPAWTNAGGVAPRA